MRPYVVLLSASVVLIGCTNGSGQVDPPRSRSSIASSQQRSMPISELSSPVNTTGLPLNVPAGYSIEIFAKDLPGARVLAKDSFGNYWVSQPSQGTVTQLEVQNKKVIRQNALFRNLTGPHGLAINPASGTELFIAEEHQIRRAHLYSDAPLDTVAALPGTGRHSTRTLGIGPDDRLYVSVGSTCDVCVEPDERAAAMLSMNLDGTDERIVAKGLRNSVFFRWHPVTKELWATDMGRDQLGDNLPPEDVNIIREGKHYGWPFCYGNRIRDAMFQASKSFDCAMTEAPVVQLPAHIAPLGLAFIAGSGEYAGDLLVAEHGSWNSSVKVGYKVVRVPLSSSGTVEGPPEDFLTGFLQTTVIGRPVDVFTEEDGDIFITDDKAGVVYRMWVRE